MRYLKRLLLLTLIYVTTYAPMFAYSSTHDTELYNAVYKGKHSGFNITLTRSLLHTEDNNYILKSKAKSLLGSITETSKFSLNNGQFVPNHYRYLRKIFGKESDRSLSFDWVTMQASFLRSDKPKKNATFDLKTGTLDPSLYQLRLQQQLANNSESLQFLYAKEKRVKEISFSRVEKATYTLNKTIYDALILERNNTKDTKKTRITVIPELGYTIAKIEHTDKKGSKYRIDLVSFSSNQLLLDAFYSSQL